MYCLNTDRDATHGQETGAATPEYGLAPLIPFPMIGKLLALAKRLVTVFRGFTKADGKTLGANARRRHPWSA